MGGDNNMRGSPKFQNLTSKVLLDIISKVCHQANQDLPSSLWTFAPAHAQALRRVHGQLLGDGAKHVDEKTFDTNLLLGVLGQESNNNNIKDDGGQWLCTFYLAYSTWEGRVIFWDQVIQASDAPTEGFVKTKDKFDAERIFARLVSKIGQALQCRRMVWVHRGVVPTYGPVPAETLQGWLTLYWDLPDMQAFAPYHRKPTSGSNGVKLSLKQAFEVALEQGSHERFRLRLATEDDINVIDRLVLGLANFEGEPESYILSKQQLKQDGFSGRSLYYCILVDDIAEEYTCAMALCYVACDLSGGRFLYLEDLFVEEAYRGKGGGKLVMSTLALVAQSLQCTKLKWQALYWNKPALTFYNSLGARVQDGLITSRFAGQDMDKFAELPLLEDL